MPLRNLISIEKLKKDIDIKVRKGTLQGHNEAFSIKNKLKLIELQEKTGCFHIVYDPKYHANVVLKKISFL